MTSLEGREVWFLTGSQGMYGEETLRQVAEGSRQIVAALDAAADIPVTVRWLPVLTDAEAIRRTMLDANSADGCVGLIAWMPTFSPAKMWIAGLDALRKPLLHLHTQANVELPWATIDMDFMNLNQAAHGDREFGYIQTRLGVPRKTVAGHVSEPAIAERIGTWARAAAGAAELHTLKLARFGDNMRDVAVTEIDTVAPPEPLPQLPVARAVWRPRPDLRTSAEAWITAGAPHHTVYSAALGAEHLADFAELAEVELLVIDADTDPRRFAQEIRWNQAYHRLARGF